MDQGPPPSRAPTRMSREAYREWAMAQERRHELLEGEPVAMNPERRAHAAVKMNVYVAFRDAISAAGLECEAVGDGMTVEVGPDTDFEPDALVSCGPRIPLDSISVPNPVVVVEVLSRSTRSIDTGRKFRGYFRVPSIRHYLVVEAERRFVMHHRRDGEAVMSAIVTEGAIVCDPPGLSITMDEIYAGISA